MVADTVVEKAHQAVAFSIMPFIGNAGSILGPVLGGAYRPRPILDWLYSLADPVKLYPAIFGNSTFLAKFPYALPNLAIASLLLVISISALLFMNETLDSKKNEIDLGVKFRRFMHRMFKAIFHICSPKRSSSRGRRRTNFRASEISEFSSDDEEELSRGHRRHDIEEPMLLSSATWRTRSNSFSGPLMPAIPNVKQPPTPRFRDIFTKQVIINMLVFSGLALHTFSFDQLFPLLCSTKIQDGGMDMTPGQIGMALSAAGVMAMILQFTLFPWGHNKFGGLFCLRTVLGMYSILYFVLPSCGKLLTQSVSHSYRNYTNPKNLITLRRSGSALYSYFL